MHLTVVHWQDGAHHNPFLQLVPASCTCLGRVADMEFVKVLGYETLGAWWYVEEVEREADELLGYQNVGLCKIQPNHVEIWFVALGCMHLLPDPGWIFHTARKTWDIQRLRKWRRCIFLQIFPSTFIRATTLKWLMSWVSFSFRMEVVMALLLSDGMV